MDDFRKSLGLVTQTDGVWEPGSFAEWREKDFIWDTQRMD